MGAVGRGESVVFGRARWIRDVDSDGGVEDDVRRYSSRLGEGGKRGRGEERR